MTEESFIYYQDRTKHEMKNWNFVFFSTFANANGFDKLVILLFGGCGLCKPYFRLFYL